LASRLQKRPALRVLKGGRARLSAHAHLQLAAFAGRLVGNQNSYQQHLLAQCDERFRKIQLGYIVLFVLIALSSGGDLKHFIFEGIYAQ